MKNSEDLNDGNYLGVPDDLGHRYPVLVATELTLIPTLSVIPWMVT